MIVFSDEVEQSYLRYSDIEQQRLGRPITKPIVQNLVRNGIKLKVYSFSTGGWRAQADFWEDISLAGNGTNFDLTSDALSMYNDLMSIIDEACLPRREVGIEDEQALMCVPLYDHHIPSHFYDKTMPASLNISL